MHVRDRVRIIGGASPAGLGARKGRAGSVTLALAAALSAPAAGPLASQTPAPRPADVASPEAIVTAMYESINRRPGENFDWQRMRSLFVPGAVLIPSTEQTGGEFRVLSVDDFVRWIDENTVVGGPSDVGFQEEQIAYRIERYGDVAQVFSTYQKRFWGASEILGRGINAISLVDQQDRWWVVSVVWDEEIGAGPLPARYLPGGGG